MSAISISSWKGNIVFFNIGANFVGKYVELNWAQLSVITGLLNSSTFESFNLGFCWVKVVSLKVSFDSVGEFLLGDLTVSVGVNLMEDFVRLGHGDTWSFCSGDSDGSGGGDEGEKGEFHFSFVLFF